MCVGVCVCVAFLALLLSAVGSHLVWKMGAVQISSVSFIISLCVAAELHWCDCGARQEVHPLPLQQAHVHTCTRRRENKSQTGESSTLLFFFSFFFFSFRSSGHCFAVRLHVKQAVKITYKAQNLVREDYSKHIHVYTGTCTHKHTAYTKHNLFTT